MSGAELDDTLALTNYQRVSDPRRLTHAEIDQGYEEPGDAVSETYYAIMRADGYVGQDIGRHTKSPKIRVLFVTADGNRAVEKLQRATETDAGADDHDFAGSYPVAIQRDPGHGNPVPEDSQAGYRQRVAELHGLEEVEG